MYLSQKSYYFNSALLLNTFPAEPLLIRIKNYISSKKYYYAFHYDCYDYKLIMFSTLAT